MRKRKTFNSDHRPEKEYKESKKEQRELRGTINKLKKENGRLKKELARRDNMVPDEVFEPLIEAEKKSGIPNPLECPSCKSEDVFKLPINNKEVNICRKCKNRWTLPATPSQNNSN